MSLPKENSKSVRILGPNGYLKRPARTDVAKVVDSLKELIDSLDQQNVERADIMAVLGWIHQEGVTHFVWLEEKDED